MSVAKASTWEERMFDLGNVPDEQKLEGGKVLPGWQVDIADLFSRLDRTSDMP
jgi:hypothetical protein